MSFIPRHFTKILFGKQYFEGAARYIIDGLELALESLCEPSPRQAQLLENNSQVGKVSK